jgi:type II secretory pathway component GspD/PulD (secretin)
MQRLHHNALLALAASAFVVGFVSTRPASVASTPVRASFTFTSKHTREATIAIANRFGVVLRGASALSGRVTLHLSDVTLDRALRAVLTSSGFTFVKSGGAIFIVPVRLATPAASYAPTVLSLTVIPASRASAILEQLYPQARIAVDAQANSLIVVAEPNDVNGMRSVLQGIDVRNPLQPVTEAIPLHVARSVAVAAQLRGLYRSARIEPGPNKTLLVTAPSADLAQIKAVVAALDAPPTPSPAPQATPSTTEAIHLTQARPQRVAREVAGALRGLRVQVAGDSIVLSGPPEQVARGKDLIAVLDQPPNGVRYTQVYRLHYLDAASVGDLIARSFSDVRVTIDKDINAVTVWASVAEQHRIADAIAQLDANIGAPPVGQPGATQQFAGPGGGYEIYNLRAAMPGLNGAASTSASDIAQALTQALSQTAPDLRVTIAPNQQALILVGSPYSIKIAKDLIGQLDVAQKLVVLDTEVLEMDENVAKNLGLQITTPVIGSTFSEVSPPPDINGNPQRLIGFQAIQRSGLSLSAQLNLLIQKGSARVLADPRITTISGRTATIRAGDTIAIATTTGGGAGTIATTQLQTFQTGVTLDITPIVNSGGFISVALHPVVNSLSGIVNGIPQIATRDTQTTVALQEDQTLIIGGLIQESTSRTEQRLPILGDLPLLGRLFRNSEVNHTRNELVITVTPHIVVPGEPAPFPRLPNAPSAQPLPTLPPGTTLPARSRAPASVEPGPPAPNVGPIPPVMTAQPAGPPSSSTSPSPIPTPSAFAQTNTFTYGEPPQNNFAGPPDAVQIFYATLSPTVLRSGTQVKIAVITTTNVAKVTVGYGGFTTQVAQSGPGKWLSTYAFSTSGLPVPPATVSLNLVASRLDGTSATIAIPVSITQ